MSGRGGAGRWCPCRCSRRVCGRAGPGSEGSESGTVLNPELSCKPMSDINGDFRIFSVSVRELFKLAKIPPSSGTIRLVCWLDVECVVDHLKSIVEITRGSHESRHVCCMSG